MLSLDILQLKLKRLKYTPEDYDVVTIRDSYPILYLAKLCENFTVEIYKGDFPHKFANQNTLSYKD